MEENYHARCTANAALERAELRPNRHPLGAEKTVPPMVIWRFKYPQPRLEGAVQDAIKRFNGNIAWVLDKKRNTWALYPRRVREISEEKKLAGLLAGIDLLMAEEPEFGIQANEEFEALTVFLQKVLSQKTYTNSVQYAHS
jgi:hypothetical protein